jgi:hypothetical protein
MTALRVAFVLEGHRDYQVIPAFAQRVATAEFTDLQLSVASRFGRKRGFGFISELGDVLRALDNDGVPLCVAVVDANGDESRRLKSLREAVARVQPLAVTCVTGVAVRALEAWLLADEQAIGAALMERPAVPRQPEPRSIRDPKAALQELIGSCTGGVEFFTDAIGRNIAQAADLSVVRKRCHDFDEFYREFANCLRQYQPQDTVR